MSDFWDKKEIIGSITKNKKDEIIISKCERNKKEYIDIRIHSKTKDSGDTYLYTSKGINLDINKKDKLIDLLKQI